MANCRGCGAPISFITMESGKRMPVDILKPVKIIIRDGNGIGHVVEGWGSHFATCPESKKFRKKGGNQK